MSFRLDHLHIKVTDPEAAKDFFVDSLGAVMLAELGAGTYGYRVDLHGLVVNLTTLSPGQVREQHYGIEHIAIATDDFGGAIEGLTGGGAKVLEEIRTREGLRVSFLEGSDGVQFELLERGNGKPQRRLTGLGGQLPVLPEPMTEWNRPDGDWRRRPPLPVVAGAAGLTAAATALIAGGRQSARSGR